MFCPRLSRSLRSRTTRGTEKRGSGRPVRAPTREFCGQFSKIYKKIYLMDFLFCRWALAQTGILLVMGAWQMRHLKSFFEAKKLV